MKTSPTIAKPSLKRATTIATLTAVLLFLPGCTRIARFCYLSSYDRDIGSATKAIESARDNAHRAEAYASHNSDFGNACFPRNNSTMDS
jgi:hypothetical protein